MDASVVGPPIESPDTGRTILSLIKFGAQQHVEELRRSGRLYMRTLGYFIGLEDQHVRGDADEGVSMLLQPNLITLSIGDIEIPSADMVGPVKVALDQTRDLHVFCMHAITDKRGTKVLRQGVPPVDPRNLAFGEYALFITNPSEFLERMSAAARRANTNLWASLVHYLDPASHHGRTSVFNKAHGYAWQSEYRVVIERTGQDVGYLTLGSLEDISLAVPSRSIDSQLTFRAG